MSKRPAQHTFTDDTDAPPSPRFGSCPNLHRWPLTMVLIADFVTRTPPDCDKCGEEMRVIFDRDTGARVLVCSRRSCDYEESGEGRRLCNGPPARVIVREWVPELCPTCGEKSWPPKRTKAGEEFLGWKL